MTATDSRAVTGLVLASLQRIGEENLLVTIDGQEIELAPRGGTGTGGGPPEYSLDEELPGTNTAVYSFASTIAGSESLGVFVLGHETSPAGLGEIGAVTYRIGIVGGGVQTINGADPLGLEIMGDGTIDVSFDSSTISGRGTIGSDIGAGTAPDAFSIVGGQIVGNGFTANIVRECPTGSTCTSDSKIGGAFFGENAAEIAGIGTIAETQQTNGDVAKIDGVIGFSGAKDVSTQ
ncbi:transferrin-binding protein-like solute binding protein [Yoonia sp.]|uniref:transferrin-binding protein-like solute binding protein n=1 Tax=Yoonia sp. TaxID=2212373 RepID=UPI003F6C68E5